MKNKLKNFRRIIYFDRQFVLSTWLAGVEKHNANGNEQNANAEHNRNHSFCGKNGLPGDQYHWWLIVL